VVLSEDIVFVLSCLVLSCFVSFRLGGMMGWQSFVLECCRVDVCDFVDCL